MRRSSRRSGRTKPTKTSGSDTRRRSRRSSRLRDDAETKKLSVFSSELQGLENALPIDPKLRNSKLGALAPIRVVNVFSLRATPIAASRPRRSTCPNDDRVIKEKGSKRVMLKNVQEAKFQKVLTPISGVALGATDRAKVSFDAFFTHILMHELMHGLGPHQVTGRRDKPCGWPSRTPYSAIEEAKADISGLWALQQLADKGVISKQIADSMYTTFLASAFRSIRFGITEAHGKGIALQLNSAARRWRLRRERRRHFQRRRREDQGRGRNLTRDLMTIQAAGDYAAAKDLLTKMVVIRPEVQRVLDKLKDVPVDIEPTLRQRTALTKCGRTASLISSAWRQSAAQSPPASSAPRSGRA